MSSSSGGITARWRSAGMTGGSGAPGRKEMLEEGKTLHPCPSWAPTHDMVSGDQLETLCCTVTDSSACCRGEVTGLAAAFQLLWCLQYFQFLIPSLVPDSPFLVTIFNNERSNSTVKLQLGSSLPSQCVEGLGIGLISAAVTGWCSWFSASLCCWVFFHYHCTPGSFALLSYFWSYLLVSFSVPLKVFWSVFF